MALSAALVPLALTQAQAAVAVSPVGITTSTSTSGGFATETFTVTNNTGGTRISFIEIPEITKGDLKFTGFDGTSLPFGWTATEVTTSSLASSMLYTGTAASYIDLMAQATFMEQAGFGIANGSSLAFTANVPTISLTNAQFSAQTDESVTSTTFPGLLGMPSQTITTVVPGLVYAIDPGIPNTGSASTPVPEPATLTVFGAALLGLTRLRRRLRD